MSERIAYSIANAVAACGGAVSRSGLYQAFKTGRIKLRKNGKRSYVLAADLTQFLQNQPK